MADTVASDAVRNGLPNALLNGLLEPALAELAVRLGAIGGLAAAERDIVHAAARTVLLQTVRLTTDRLLRRTERGQNHRPAAEPRRPGGVA